MQNTSDKLPQGLGTLLRSLLLQLDPSVDQAYSARVPRMRSRYYPVIRELAVRTPRTIGELAQAAGVSQPAMTQTVSQMVMAGFVENTAGTDRRSRPIALSPDGSAAVRELVPAFRAVARAADELDRELSMPLAAILKEALAALERRNFAARIEATEDKE